VIAGCLLLLTAACTQSSPPPASQPAPAAAAPAPTATASAPMLMEEAAMCGRSLGIAVRCNMVSDQNDFAILRHMTLNGLRAQSQSPADYSQAEMAFDVAALEMMNSVGACQGPAASMRTLEQTIQGNVAHCAGTR
jgi:hypothetical protein